MTFAHNHDVIKTLAAYAPQQSFADGVGARRSDRRAEHINAASNRNSLEVPTVLCIIVTNEILRRLAKGRRLAQLLSDPFVSW